MKRLSRFFRPFRAFFEDGITRAWGWLKAKDTAWGVSASFGHTGGCTNEGQKGRPGAFDTAWRESRQRGWGFLPGARLVLNEGAGQKQAPINDGDQGRPQLGVTQGGSGEGRPQQVLLDETVEMFNGVTTQVEAPIRSQLQLALTSIHQPQVGGIAAGATRIQTLDMNDSDGMLGRRSEMQGVPDGDFQASQFVIAHTQ